MIKEFKTKTQAFNFLLTPVKRKKSSVCRMWSDHPFKEIFPQISDQGYICRRDTRNDDNNQDCRILKCPCYIDNKKLSNVSCCFQSLITYVLSNVRIKPKNAENFKYYN